MKNRLIICILYFFFFLFQVLGQKISSPFNHLAITVDSVHKEFSFLIAGHLHGSSTNISGFPASSLLANLDNINSMKAYFMISLGDLFIDVDDYYVTNYRKSFFEKLKIPLFNAVGNHDLSRNRYEDYFGKTYFYFIFNNAMFIFLDTEINDGSIKGEQMVFLKKVIEEVSANSQVINIFISSHRPVWAENNPVYAGIFDDNTQTVFGKNNFETEIYPLLHENLKNKSVFWMSGSLGSAPASFFYDKKEDANITYIATAIRDLKRDALLSVKINAKGEVTFQPVSLTGQTLNPIETYNILFWKKNKKEIEGNKFNFRLLPYMIKQMIAHYYFFTGFGAGITFFIMLFAIVRKIKRNFQ